MSMCASAVYSLLLQRAIPLNRYTTIYLYIHLLMDILSIMNKTALNICVQVEDFHLPSLRLWTWSGNCMYGFSLYPIKQNLVTWPHLTTREMGKIVCNSNANCRSKTQGFYCQWKKDKMEMSGTDLMWRGEIKSGFCMVGGCWCH